MGSNFAEPEAKNSGVDVVVPAGSTQYHDSKDSTDKYLDHPPLRKNIYYSNTGIQVLQMPLPQKNAKYVF